MSWGLIQGLARFHLTRCSSTTQPAAAHLAPDSACNIFLGGEGGGGGRACVAALKELGWFGVYIGIACNVLLDSTTSKKQFKRACFRVVQKFCAKKCRSIAALSQTFWHADAFINHHNPLPELPISQARCQPAAMLPGHAKHLMARKLVRSGKGSPGEQESKITPADDVSRCSLHCRHCVATTALLCHRHKTTTRSNRPSRRGQTWSHQDSRISSKCGHRKDHTSEVGTPLPYSLLLP